MKKLELTDSELLLLEEILSADEGNILHEPEEAHGLRLLEQLREKVATLADEV